MNRARPGRDRSAVRHPAPSGGCDAGLLARRPHVVVIGGGIAGLAAATGLAERGVRVTLLEREQQLGGRVAGWTQTMPGGPRLPMSRGFHAFFRQYYNLRALLRRADPGLSRLVPVADYPLIDACGRRDSFRGLPRTPPWNAIAFALRSPTFQLHDLLSLNAAAAAPLATVSVPGIYHRLDDVDAATFLRRINFPAAARHLAFDVFSRSFFAEPAQLSAAELAAMFHIYFLGSSEGLVFDVPDAGFDTALWDPLGGYLAALGVDIRTGAEAGRVDFLGPGMFRVHDGAGGALGADGLVLATDVAGLRQIVESSPTLAEPHWRGKIAQLRNAPPFLVRRLWLDRAVLAKRPAFLAVGGRPPLDNISVLERYDSQARHWAVRTGGSVVELHAYAARDRSAGERVVAAMHELYPETRRAAVVAESVLWRADCPLFGLGHFARRPRVRTSFGGLVLAGPYGTTVADVELVAWRDEDERLIVGPGACPHLGAPLSKAVVDCGELVCRWHGLRIGGRAGGGWRALPAHDDGVLTWVRLDAVDGEPPLAQPAVPVRPLLSRSVHAVATLTGVCEPEDIVANRLDPWHGGWFHPYFFSRLSVLSAPTEMSADVSAGLPAEVAVSDQDDRFVVSVTFRVSPGLGVPVRAEFTCPEPRTVVMRITEGEGTGSVVETHATPLGRGPDGRPRTAVIEAVIAHSQRPGFALARRASPALRPVIKRAAARLWRDDLAYAERRYWLRSA